MNSATKVGEIFAKAGDSYNKIGDMIVMLHPAAQELMALEEKQVFYDVSHLINRLINFWSKKWSFLDVFTQSITQQTTQQYVMATTSNQPGTTITFAQQPVQQQQHTLISQQTIGGRTLLTTQGGNLIQIGGQQHQVVNGINLPQQPLPISSIAGPSQQYKVEQQQQHQQQYSIKAEPQYIKAEPQYTIHHIQTPDMSALLEAAGCHPDPGIITSDTPVVGNEEEIANIVHTS